ncbi:MAG: Nramp family divalent metal transporter [Bacteroidota bacterium]
MRLLKTVGPGPLIAAAFIGPGTVTICTLAGVNFGYALLWAMVLSVIATLVLQGMAARLGIVSGRNLAEVIRAEIKHPLFRPLMIILILSAIVIGNAAYEAGNISGGVLGLETIFGNHTLDLGVFSLNYFSLAIGVVAFVLLYIGNYKVLQNVLVGLVIVMSLAFIVSAILVKPDLSAIFKGALVPTFPKGSLIMILGLIGTTVVPYNLFLHSALVKEQWKEPSDIRHATYDTLIAVILGGIISMCIMISAAAIDISTIENASDLAKALEPLLGANAKYVLSIGLFAAGITSAVTAPLAAAYVASGCLGWASDLKSKRFKAVWIVILIAGVVSSSTSIKSIEIIKFAQVANGILLPVIAGVLLWIMNRSTVLNKYRNSKIQNILGGIIVMITIILGVKGILSVFNIL